MSKTKTKSDSFILELPLVVSPKQKKELLTRFESARQLYNACLGESLRRLRHIKQSKVYKQTLSMPKGKSHKAFKSINETFRFREYDLHSFAKHCRNSCHIKDHVDSLTAQKIATRAFNAVKEYSFGKRGKPRFKGKNQLKSVEGKNNDSGIKWKNNRVVWSGLEIKPKFDPKDKHGVQAHALDSKVKFSRMVKRTIKGKSRFFVQLVLAGNPKIKHEAGSEIIGLDLGPSSIACVGETDAFLKGFCSELEPVHKEIRKIQRKLDRSRRSMNPDNYNSNGTVKSGKRIWKLSARYSADRSRLTELNRKLSQYRKRLQGKMANLVLKKGIDIKIENLSYKSWQRNFGKSVGFRAPGMFVSMLRRKAENAGGKVNEFSAYNALSQVCHCGLRKKKSLSMRWHKCDCGAYAQRDLYSAFLARYVQDNTLDTSHALNAWPTVKPLLDRAVSSVKQSASGWLPSSFGVQRQSGSHGKDGSGCFDVRNAVPVAWEQGESGRDAAHCH